MKAFFITTETNETPKYPESLASINGNKVRHHIFDHRTRQKTDFTQLALHNQLWASAKKYEPEVVVYLGACGGNIPSPQFLAKMNAEIAPTVLMCSDAGDEVSPWWPLIREYDKEKSFSVIVGIDGNRNWEFSDQHITLLTPIDPNRYPSPPIPHAKREMVFGFAGNMGSVSATRNGLPAGRRTLIDKMMLFGLQCRQRDDTYDQTKPHSQSYQAACDFMADTRMMPNFCETGSYQRTHVKGRVVEAGLAGTMLLEQVGSPADQWFEKGADYLEFKDVEDCRKIVERYQDHPEETQAFGFRLRDKIMKDHTPDKFWGRVFERISDAQRRRVLREAVA